jgi:hypothetical protein
MIEELEHAVLTVDLPDHNLKMGDIGVVVHVYKSGAAYKLEFFTVTGETIDVVTVEANQVRPVSSTDVLHARSLVSAGK